MPVLLTNVLDGTNLLILLNLAWPLSIYLFNICDEMRSTFVLHTEIGGYEESIFSLSCKLNYFFLGMPFWLKRMTGRQVIAIQLGYVADIFSKWMNWVCHFKKNKWQYLLPVTKFELSHKNWNFGNLVSDTANLRASQYLKTFHELCGNINEFDFFFGFI